MLLPCICQRIICPSNPKYKPLMLICSHAHMRQLCQYICITWIQCNQQCDWEQWYTYISHYWHMTLNKYAFKIAHICPTALLLWSIYVRTYITTHTSPKKLCNFQVFKYHTIVIYVLPRNMPLECHIFEKTYANYFICRYHTTMTVYIPHMNSMQWTLWPWTLVHMYSTLLEICPEQICLSHCTFMSNCTATAVYI